MPLTVLLVEDNPDDAELLGEILAGGPGERVTLHVAETLRDGLAGLAREPVDVLLLDLSLPDSDGVETVRRARAVPHRVPIIVLTGSDDDALGIEAIHAGAQDYLAKGALDGALLRRSMRYAIERHRLLSDLEESNAVKTYFAATMSHELRNTVFAIAGYSDMVLDALERADGAAAERLSRAIGVRARESLQLIQAALEVTRSEVRAAPGEGQDLVVGEFLEQLQREIEPLRNGRGPGVEWSVAARLPPLRTDPVKLRMVLKNLIANALKFTEQGTVRVSADRAGERMRLTVSDSGIGIPPEELPHLFEPFRQAHAQLSRGAGGAGLGLFIVRRLVDLLGGTIAVSSVPGQGTSFAVELPLRVAPGGS
jgi:signal transduction histidine kinase